MPGEREGGSDCEIGGGGRRGREMKIAAGEKHDGKGVTLTEGNCQLEKSELKEEMMEVEVGAKEDRSTVQSQDNGVGGKVGCLPWLAVI